MMHALEPLRRRLPLALCGLLTLAVAGVCAFGYEQIRSALLRASAERAQGAAARIGAALDESAWRVRHDAERAAAEVAVRGALTRPFDRSLAANLGVFFAAEHARAPQLVALAVISRDGRHTLVADSARGVTVGALPPAIDAADERVVRVPPPAVGPLAIVDGRPTYDIAVPVFGSRGDTTGFFVATRRVEPPASSVIDHLLGPDAVVLVGNLDGTAWTRLAGEAQPGRAVVGAGVAQLAPWRVLVRIPSRAALAPARHFLWTAIPVALLIIAGTALIAWRLTRNATRPLRALRAAAGSLAEGNYGSRMRLARHDELGELAAAFDEMAERIEGAAADRAAYAAELKAANDELRDSERRYRQLVELTPDAIVLSRGGRILFCNPAAIALFGGGSAEELVGRPVIDVVPPAEQTAVLERVAASEYGRRAVPLVNRTLRRLDGTLLETETVGMPFVLDGVPAVLTVIRDLTERRRAEAALREIEARYRHVVMNVPGTVYQLVYGADGGFEFTLVSDGARELLGVDPEEMRRDARRWLDLLHPADREEFNAGSARAVATLAPWHWEGRIVLPGGEEKWVQLAARQLRQADGTVRSDGLLLDVTERRRAARRLEESELRFHLAARATRDIVYDWDIASDTLFWGETLTSAFGYDPQEIEPATHWWIARLHPDDVENVLASLDDALGSAADAWTAEYRFRCRDGRYASVLDRAYLVRDEEGRATRLVGSMTDLTERKALEQQLRQSQKMEAIGQLAGGVAHDFNNILTAITSYSDLLLSDTEEADPRHDWAQEIRKGADRAAALTRQLLAFSRRQVLQPRTIDLNHAVRELEKMLRRLLVEDVTLVVALDAELGAVRADPGQIEQVLVNLAVNARDAMPSGGSLTIQTANVDVEEAQMDAGRQVTIPPGRYVRVAVSDTGCGMDEATIAHVFEPFFTTKEPGKGTGLGLSTVYGIVKQSGGYIRCDSEPGAGTVFGVYLPRVDAAVEVPPARESVDPPVHAVRPGVETVLLVEDDVAVRDVSRRILRQCGYTVLEATNGVEALACCDARGETIDLIVTDMVMPEMNGPDLAREIRARHPRIAILFMSGYSEDAALRESFLEPGTAFIEKPFAPKAFAARVRQVLDARQRGQELVQSA